MKPKPFCGLNHFTVPIAMTIPFGCERSNAPPHIDGAIIFRLFEGVRQNEQTFPLVTRVVRPNFDDLTLRRSEDIVNGVRRSRQLGRCGQALGERDHLSPARILIALPATPDAKLRVTRVATRSFRGGAPDAG